jgi:hypothetical protein
MAFDLKRATPDIIAQIGSIPEPALEVWSKPFWQTLYFAARKYPDAPTQSEKSNMKTFMYAIDLVLPCTSCSTHFKEELDTAGDGIFSSKTTLFLFLFDTYNHIRARYGAAPFAFEDSVKAVRDMASPQPAQLTQLTHPHKKTADRRVGEYVATGLVAFGAGVATGMGISVHDTRRRLGRI